MRQFSLRHKLHGRAYRREESFLSMAFIEHQKEVLYNELNWFLGTDAVSFQYIGTSKLREVKYAISHSWFVVVTDLSFGS